MKREAGGQSTGDPLCEIVTWALTRQRRESTWEERFARVALENRRLKVIARSLANQYPMEAEDILQALIAVLLEKLRKRSIAIKCEAALYSMLFVIAKRLCIASIQGAWITVSLDGHADDGHYQSGNAHRSSQEHDEGLTALALEQTAFIATRHTAARLRSFMPAASCRRDREVHNSLETHGSQKHYSQTGISTTRRSTPVTKTTLNNLLTKRSSASRRPDVALGSLGTSSANYVQEMVQSAAGRPLAKVKRVRNISRQPTQQKLFDYWLASGMSQENFAGSLDITTSAFKSYIYNKTKIVPQRVLEKAEADRIAAEPLVNALNKRFSVPMSQILARWSKMLNLQNAKDEEIATVLGVNHTTVLRWRSRGMQPTLRSLAKYEMTIRKWTEKAKSPIDQPASRPRRDTLEAIVDGTAALRLVAVPGRRRTSSKNPARE